MVQTAGNDAPPETLAPGAPLPSSMGMLTDFFAPPQSADEIGRLGPYRVLKLLGAGGMGAVYKAEDPQLRRIVAIKVMLPEIAANPTARQRFLREARAIAGVEHDHIVTIFQVDEDRGIPFLAMQYLQGEALDKRLRRGPLPMSEVVRIGREIALGLSAAHDKGLIHRDIKPGNIWLETKPGQEDAKGVGRVKLLDFGLARPVDDDHTHLTQAGALAGTPAYMAPEQFDGVPPSQSSDLFSLGCVLYELAAGKRPFRGTTTMSLIKAITLDDPPSPLTLKPEVPVALSDLIMRLLKKTPDERPKSAHTVATALKAIAETEIISESEAPPPLPPIAPVVTLAPPPIALPPPVSVPPPIPTASPKSRRIDEPMPEPALPLPKERKRGSSVGWGLAVGGLLLVVLMIIGGIALVVALGLSRTPAAMGTIVVDADDPTIEILVKQGATTVAPRSNRRKLELNPGTYEIVLAEPRNDIDLQTPRVTVVAGKEEVVTIRTRRNPIVPLVAGRATSQDGRIIWAHSLDAAGYQAWVEQGKRDGYRPFYVNAHGVAGTTRFNAVGTKTAIPSWDARHNLTQTRYEELFKELSAKDYRMLSISEYFEAGAARYATVWVKTDRPLGWWAVHNVSPTRLESNVLLHEQKGARPTVISGAYDGQSHRFCAIFTEDKAPRTPFYDLTSEQYTEKTREWSAKSYRPISVSGYQTANGTRFSAIFSGNPTKKAWQSRHNLTPGEFQQLSDQLTPQGFHPTVICGYPAGGETRIATIWVKD